MYNVVNHQKFISELPKKQRSKKLKAKEMSYEQAAEIANDMLYVAEFLFKIFPLFNTATQGFNLIGGSQKWFPRTSKFTENRPVETVTFEVLPESVRRKFSYSQADEDGYIVSPIYQIIEGNRKFDILLFDSPNDCGYNSMLLDYNPDTYILFEIMEKRPTGETKYEMVFGVDIEKGTFIELFDIIHTNSCGLIRQYGCSYKSRLEDELKDTVILL